MKELKKDSRKSIQVSKETHDILVAIKKIQNHLPLGKIVDSIVKERYEIEPSAIYGYDVSDMSIVSISIGDMHFQVVEKDKK